MKVILLKELNSLGEEGAVVDVTDGYARNFLLPRQLAVVATSQSLAAVAEKKKAEERKIERERKIYEELKDKVAGKEVVIASDVGEEGKLFGSVGTADIARSLKETLAVEIDKKKITLEEPIKRIGEYKVSLKLFPGIECEVKVIVAASPKSE